MLQCLTDSVGVTTSDCECIITGLTSEQVLALKVSKSGLYLDNLPGGVQLKALNNVDACRKMAEMAHTAIANAVKATEDDLIIALNNTYEQSRNTYIGTIGRMSFATTLGVSKRWQGIRIRPRDESDAVMELSRIMVIINDAQTFNVRLFKVPYDSVMGQEIGTWEVTTEANAYASIPVNPVQKLFFLENGTRYEYWLVYDRDEAGGAFLPKDTKIDCSTCSSNAQRGLIEYVTVNGVQVDSMSALNVVTTDEYSHGLIVDVKLTCDKEKLMCREYNHNDAIARALSNAVWYKAGELLIEDVQKQTDVSRYTTMKSEYLWGKRNHFKKEYETRITYVGAVIDVTASNCYVCRETINQPFFAGIYS